MKKMKELRLATGRSMRETAQRLGIPYTTYVNYEKGVREPTQKMLICLADFFGVTVDQLIGRRSADDDNDIPFSSKMIDDTNDFAMVPLLGDIACGAPILAMENPEAYLPCPAHIRADFCLQCHGDSMNGARIYDGDLVYVRAQSTVENGQIAAVLIDNEATLKRVYLRGDTLILQPENPSYQPLVFQGADIEQVRILGLAVWFSGFIK